MWEWTGNGQAFKTDKLKKRTIKGLLPLTPKPVNLKYASSSSFSFGISDTTTGCNSKLAVSQDPSVVAVMSKGELKSSWRTSE